MKLIIKIIKYFLLGLLGLISALLIYGLIEPYFVDIEPQVAVIPNLSPAWQGKRIAVIGDWQVGMWLDNTPTVRRIVAQLVQNPPAAVLIIGDFLYAAGVESTQEIDQVIELVRPLPSVGIPTYAVLGNHDYGMKSKNGNPDVVQANKLAKALESVGVEVLENEAIALPSPSQTEKEGVLYLVGVGAHWPNNDKPIVALKQVPNEVPRFVMMHNPDSFAAFPANTAPIAVAGHTHGGQIRLPFLPEWSWLTLVKEDEVHSDGWIENYGEPGNHLYVNRGIGLSILPVRINCPPEVTLFTLSKVES